MRIAIEKATGKIIEMQSIGTNGTLLANAIAAGYDPEAIEERSVTSVEYRQLLAEQVLPERAASPIDYCIAFIASQPGAPKALVDLVSKDARYASLLK